MPARRRTGPRRVMSLSLWEPERSMLMYMAAQEDRYNGEMIRVLIREGAKLRGLTPEMFEQPEQVQA